MLGGAGETDGHSPGTQIPGMQESLEHDTCQSETADGRFIRHRLTRTPPWRRALRHARAGGSGIRPRCRLALRRSARGRPSAAAVASHSGSQRPVIDHGFGPNPGHVAPRSPPRWPQPEPGLLVHAAEASNGDFRHDTPPTTSSHRVVWSGGQPEMKKPRQLLKRFALPMIAVTSKRPLRSASGGSC